MSTRTFITVFAAAAAGAALVTSAGPANAAPCTAWKLDAGALVINQDNGVVVSVDWPANTNKPTSGSYSDFKGPASGGIVGGNKLDFTIDFQIVASGAGDGPSHYSNHYTGTIEEVMDGFGRAKGTTVNNEGASNTWTANEAFTCAVAPAAEPPGKKADAAPAAPPPEASAPPPVTDAIRLSFAPPKLGSITATVTNSSPLTAQCTYDADPFGEHRDFTVPAKGTTNLTFSGFNTGTSYHVVVSCHDADGKQPQEIGHAETDVTF